AGFAASPNVLADKDIKLAAKKAESQSEVWSNVAKSQSKLSNAAGTNVQANDSSTSLELSLENRAVQGKTEDYVNALPNIEKGQTDVLGYVFAINGKINSADVYPTNALFRKLWPRLLKASAMEALGDSGAQSKPAEVTSDTAQAFLDDAEQGASSQK